MKITPPNYEISDGRYRIRDMKQWQLDCLLEDSIKHFKTLVILCGRSGDGHTFVDQSDEDIDDNYADEHMRCAVCGVSEGMLRDMAEGTFGL
jgi:hypothetical protein